MVKPHSVGHILCVEGADPARDRVVLEINGVRTVIVVVPTADQAPGIAARLIEKDGMALIELDGGIGATGAARVVKRLVTSSRLARSCSVPNHLPARPGSPIAPMPDDDRAGRRARSTRGSWTPRRPDTYRPRCQQGR